MQRFAYKARDNSGKLVQGFFEAENELDLTQHLKRSALFLTSSRVVSSKVKMRVTRGAGKLSTKELLTFTIQLAISLDAGVPLMASLKDLAKNSRQPASRQVIDDICRRVESGVSMKEALATHPRSFSALYVSIVGAGETTGKLPFVLEDLGKLLEWQTEINAKIKEASIYPLVLFFTMIGVVSVLMGVVIPRFEPMLKQVGAGLPMPTLVVLTISKAVQNYWWMGLLAIGAVVGLFMFFSSQEKGRYAIDKFKLKIPILGDLMTKVALSRFCHTFSLGLRSGINVFSALGIASEVTGNTYLQKTIGKAKDYVNMGEKIATAFELSGKEAGSQFPDIVIRMINVGEQSGSLTETLEKVNQFYDKEVPSTIRKMFALLEPMMIVVMGVVVGGIALAVFLPMIKMVSSVGD
jgi:type IV pilus assembly protein PilC